MGDASPPPTITFLTRPGCHLCDVAREELRAVLDARQAAGALVPAVVEVDIESDPALLRRYLETIPVVALGAVELPLAMRPGAIGRFLALALDAARAP